MKFIYKKHRQFPDSILIRKFDGNVNVNEIIQSWKYLLENKMITGKTKGVINDLRECELVMDMTSFQILINFLKKTDSLRKLKLAVVCEKPETIVFPTLAEFEEKELLIKPFSTETAAVNWVMFEFEKIRKNSKLKNEHVFYRDEKNFIS